jgi:uncharacterized protein YbjT (DUF2867 family)
VKDPSTRTGDQKFSYALIANLPALRRYAVALVGSVAQAGPVRVSTNELARAFSEVLGRPVSVEIVPRENWEDLFCVQGMTNPLPRMRRLGGFNEGWIEFQDHGRSAVKGNTPLVEVITALVAGGKAA